MLSVIRDCWSFFQSNCSTPHQCMSVAVAKHFHEHLVLLGFLTLDGYVVKCRCRFDLHYSNDRVLTGHSHIFLCEVSFKIFYPIFILFFLSFHH